MDVLELLKSYRKEMDEKSWKKLLSQIDKSNLDRIKYLRTQLDIMINFFSTNDEVNDLLYYLYLLVNDCNFYENYITNSDIKNFNKKIEKVNSKTLRSEVYIGDLILYIQVTGIYEYYSYKCNDILDKIIKELYFLLDETIHPYYKKEDIDLDDIKYYIELDYVKDIKD